MSGRKKGKNARRKSLRIIQNRSDPDRNLVEDNGCRRKKRVAARFGADFPTINASAEEHEAKLSLSEDTDGEPFGVLVEFLDVHHLITSVGDQHLKPNVIGEPKIEVNKRTELDEFLIIASDGLWDVVPNDFAGDVVRKCLHGQTRMAYAEVSNSAVAAAMLAELDLARGSKNNISVIVVELKRSTSNLF